MSTVGEKQRHPRPPGGRRLRRIRDGRDGRVPRGSAGRAAAGAVRIGHAVGAAFTNRRVLGPVEARLTTLAGVMLCSAAVVVALFPRLLAYPFTALAAWTGIALLYRGVKLWSGSRRSGRRERGAGEDAGAADPKPEA